jgi:hypothetical protein
MQIQFLSRAGFVARLPPLWRRDLDGMPDAPRAPVHRLVFGIPAAWRGARRHRADFY